VAAITRTSTSTSSVPPTRRKTRSCRTRKSLTWIAGLVSPISSRKTVPLSATSNRPALAATAPVKAPFTWPKSSLSRSVSGIAPQLMAMNGFAVRSLFLWMVRATSSFPVPLAPMINTVPETAATLLISLYSSIILALRPISPSTELGKASPDQGRTPDTRDAFASKALAMIGLISSTRKGLVR